jgi:hypothetical protein
MQRLCQNDAMSRAALTPLLFTFTLIALVSIQADTGLIEGTVTYEDGKPTKGATVYAHPTDRGMAAIVPHGDTDEKGYFAIRHLWLGKFAVTAKKEDEAYPDMSNAFYGDGKFEAVTLISDRFSATVAIRLGAKAGILRGTVTDAVTGASLNPCVDFRRASDPNNFFTGTGLVNAKYRVLLPSNTDVMMKVWHEGYKPWYYPGTTDQSQSTLVRVEPGEEQTLDIRLQPSKNAVEESCGMPVGTVIKP